MGTGWLGIFVVWAVLVLGSLFLLRWLVGEPDAASKEREVMEPTKILERRYAAGEIDRETFERIRRDLAA